MFLDDCVCGQRGRQTRTARYNQNDLLRRLAPMPRPDSPCVAICSTALGDEWCRGCGRSFIEVANWVCMSDAEKEVVWLRLEQFWRQRGEACPWLVRGDARQQKV